MPGGLDDDKRTGLDPGARPGTTVFKHGLHDMAGIVTVAQWVAMRLAEGHTSAGDVEMPPAAVHDLEVLQRMFTTLVQIMESLRREEEIIVKEVFNLGEWTKSVITALSGPSAQFIAINFDCPEEVPVYADKTAIWRAVHNILKNAIEVLIQEIVTERRMDGRIDVRVYVDADQMVHIEIKDNGPGIPSNIREHLFENGATTKKAEEGHGLGLARTAEVINQHQGRIDVKSQSGSTIFDLVIPRGDISIRPKLGKLEVPEVLRTGTQFIILDDEACIRELFAAILTNIAIQRPLLQSMSLGDFRQKITGLSKDLNWVLFLDGIFHGGTPSEAVDIIKALNPNAKIIYSSGSQPTDEIRDLVDAVLLKPLSIDDLVTVLSSLNLIAELK